MPRVLAASVGFLLAVGCAHHGLVWPERDLEQEVFKPDGERPLIALERRGCLGTCPAYRVEGFSDGRVVYFGIGYVATHGERKYRVDAEKVHRAAELMANTGFRSDPDYPRRVEGGHTDGRVFYLFGSLPRPKLVEYWSTDDERPDVLDASQQIDALLGTDRWVLPLQKRP